jgi:hypothetical protein
MSGSADDEPSAQELKLGQGRRAEAEREAAEGAADPDEQATHGRRAEKADYLRDRLAEREASEREGEEAG